MMLQTLSTISAIPHSLTTDFVTKASSQANALESCTPNMRVQLLGNHHPRRQHANAFIRSGFKKAYNADVQVSMPTIIALEKAELKAALGVRSASESLFIEQYLSLPIERAISTNECTVGRSQIAEIGHLYSNSSNFTLSLLIATAMLLHEQQYHTMVFTATEQLANLFDRFGLSANVIAQASAAKLSKSFQNWGTYYNTQPKVMSLNLADVNALISANRLFKVMAEQLLPQITQQISEHFTLQLSQKVGLQPKQHDSRQVKSQIRGIVNSSKAAA